MPSNVDMHRVSELRSLQYARAIASRLDADMIVRARERMRRWRSEGRLHPFYFDAWSELLAGSIQTLREAMIEDSQHASDLRQCSPFAGELAPKERWAIWARVRAEVVEEPS